MSFNHLRLLFFLAVARATLAGQGSTYATSNLPRWAGAALQSQHFGERYELYLGVNPFYQRGDFDGDGEPDLAILVREKTTRKVGIAILHRRTGDLHIVGAGIPLGNGGDDFAWLGVWRVEPAPNSALRREALYVEKPESAGGLIYWNGSRYVWVQMGD